MVNSFFSTPPLNEKVLILFGKDNSRFYPPVPFDAGKYVNFIAVDDFNNDKNHDMAVSTSVYDSVTMLLGKGDGTFKRSADPAGDGPISIAVGDFDSDTVLDLAVANSISKDVSILIGKGDGTFNNRTNYSVGDKPRSVAVGDFDSDKILDLVVTRENSFKLTILLGKGDGTFKPAVNTGQTPVNPFYVAVGDFNGDGILDLVTANLTIDKNLSIYIGNGEDGKGDGTFKPPVSYHVGGKDDVARDVDIGDFNGDGKLDLVTPNERSDNVSILFNKGDGTGTFNPAVNFPVGDMPRSVTVGDFNGDKMLDLATANSVSSDVSILTNFGNAEFDLTGTFDAFDPRFIIVGNFN